MKYVSGDSVRAFVAGKIRESAANGGHVVVELNATDSRSRFSHTWGCQVFYQNFSQTSKSLSEYGFV